MNLTLQWVVTPISITCEKMEIDLWLGNVNNCVWTLDHHYLIFYIDYYIYLLIDFNWTLLQGSFNEGTKKWETTFKIPKVTKDSGGDVSCTFAFTDGHPITSTASFVVRSKHIITLLECVNWEFKLPLFQG